MAKPHRKPKGMTLVEVMVALGVFGIATAGILSSAILSHKTSLSNVTDNVALHAAEGIMEQIRIMPYEARLLAAINAPANDPANPSQPNPLKALRLNRYKPATTTAAAMIDWQDILINNPNFVALENVSIATALNTNSVVTSARDLPVRVRILLKEVTPSANFARGTTVELIYEYKYRPDDPSPRYHTLRTFIPMSIQ